MHHNSNSRLILKGAADEGQLDEESIVAGGGLTVSKMCDGVNS